MRVERFRARGTVGKRPISEDVVVEDRVPRSGTAALRVLRFEDRTGARRQPTVQAATWLPMAREARPLPSVALPYQRAMLAALAFRAAPARTPAHAALLGLGGGVMASWLLAAFPQCKVDAFEVNEGVLAAARHAFGLETSPRLRVHLQDALAGLQSLPSGLDALFVDVGAAGEEGGLRAPPPRFLTPEAVEAMRAALQATGVAAVNLLPGRGMHASEAVGGALAVFARAFPRHAVVRVKGEANIVLVGGRGTARRSQARLLQHACEGVECRVDFAQ
mmetsp:Transcript_20807/g.69818  ORF Transcript_20807/g.69818 Transcript_20807/m.69818 type:complete len:277 (-) Transcript_20807:218-1048(-)